jgi:hypothetical protein
MSSDKVRSTRIDVALLYIAPACEDLAMASASFFCRLTCPPSVSVRVKSGAFSAPRCLGRRFADLGRGLHCPAARSS